MKVLIFHGYLLRGTGSNVYNASLAAALCRAGHEVHLVCQEHDPPAFPAGPGTVTIHRPEIGGLLPVFVRDLYEGFRVKTFPELTDAELDAYLEANVAAVREAVAAAGGVDAALANHLVMGPVILGRAGVPHALKVHGSDLSYVVLPHLDRFRPYAEEGLAAARGILVGSGHIADRLREAVDRPDVNAKVRLGPPGVDTDLFTPLPGHLRPERLRELAARLRGAGATSTAGASAAGGAGKGPDRPREARVIGDGSGDRTRGPSAWDRNTARAADALEWFADAGGPRIVFVGKLIVSKGVDLLLAAWPLVRAEHRDARLLLVGFGALERALEDAWRGLEAGELGALRELAARGWALEGGEEAPLRILGAFLDRLPGGYREAACASAGSVEFAGRLEHDEVAALVPAADALVFPSTFPEAFGMVAAEAASAGVLPVSAAHSGAAEVSRELGAALPPAAAGLVSFDLGAGAVPALAARLDAWLSLPAADREAAAAALRETVERRWSWERVAEGVIAASAGDLEELERPPTADHG